MKIVGRATPQIIGAYQNQVRGAPGGAAIGSTPSDRVTLSPEAGALRAAHEAYNRLPESRPEKIVEIQARIANGSYRVDSTRTTDAVLLGAFRGRGREAGD